MRATFTPWRRDEGVNALVARTPVRELDWLLSQVVDDVDTQADYARHAAVRPAEPWSHAGVPRTSVNAARHGFATSRTATPSGNPGGSGPPASSLVQ